MFVWFSEIILMIGEMIMGGTALISPSVLVLNKDIGKEYPDVSLPDNE